MTLPRKTENAVRYARFATRGVLTRLALMFQVNAERQFTGAEVVDILMTAVQVAGSPEERAELTAPGGKQVKP